MIEHQRKWCRIPYIDNAIFQSSKLKPSFSVFEPVMIYKGHTRLGHCTEKFSARIRFIWKTDPIIFFYLRLAAIYPLLYLLYHLYSIFIITKLISLSEVMATRNIVDFAAYMCHISGLDSRWDSMILIFHMPSLANGLALCDIV